MKTSEVVLEKIEKEEKKSFIQTVLIFPLVILIIILTKIYQNDYTINKEEILFVSAMAIGITMVLFIKIRNANSDHNYYRKLLNIQK